jgi:hypothetical protein
MCVLANSRGNPTHIHAFMFFYYIASFKVTMLSPCIRFLTKSNKYFQKEFKSPFNASDVFFFRCMCLFYSLEEVTVAYRFHRNRLSLSRLLNPLTRCTPSSPDVQSRS